MISGGQTVEMRLLRICQKGGGWIIKAFSLDTAVPSGSKVIYKFENKENQRL